MSRLSRDGVVTVPELMTVVAADRRQLADPEQRERLERSVRRVLEGLVRERVLTRSERSGRNGAHEYIAVRRRALSIA